MIGPYLTDTAVLIQKPATDIWGSESASPVEVTLAPGNANGGVRIAYETRLVQDIAGNEVVSEVNVLTADRTISHKDKLRFDGIEHGIIRITRLKDFGYQYLKVYVA